jgi:hypothetical protein
MMPVSYRGDVMPACVEVWCEKDACAMRDILNLKTRWSKKWIPLGEGYLLALVGCHWERQ